MNEMTKRRRGIMKQEGIRSGGERGERRDR